VHALFFTVQKYGLYQTHDIKLVGVLIHHFCFIVIV
jgi:hypothetical protein